jgi:hypothetical protein
VSRATTSATGAFGIYTLAPPSAFTAAVRIEREGYQPVTVAFRHHSIREIHQVVGVLTPRPR